MKKPKDSREKAAMKTLLALRMSQGLTTGRVRVLEDKLAQRNKIEDALYAIAWPKETSLLRLHRLAFAELVIHGTPSADEIAKVQSACLEFLDSSGFSLHRTLEPRSGSTILGFILMSATPLTEKESREKLQSAHSALRREKAEIEKIESQTLAATYS